MFIILEPTLKLLIKPLLHFSSAISVPCDPGEGEEWNNVETRNKLEESYGSYPVKVNRRKDKACKVEDVTK